ncbi:T6SS phospholipase effector Tle1-like catalytic domain-containing protein [Pseudomonas nicosulfuronedens]
MSEVKKEEQLDKIWAPPVFPVTGRLPTDSRDVSDNYDKQCSEENLYRQGRNAKGQTRSMDCCHSLHISLFFDGTNNNDKNDTKKDNPEKSHPSNVAKLFHATIQDDDAKPRGYYSFYMPGVGTAFPEIGEFDYSEEGLKYALGGEDRINWGLVAVAEALHSAILSKTLDQKQKKALVKSMGTPKGLSFLGTAKRRAVMKEALKEVPLKADKVQPRVLGVKLFVYGFSRGAAEARTFVNWLSELLETPDGADPSRQYLAGLPIRVEFLGLLDTVATVGIAHAAPFFAGHMDWADDTQLLPSAELNPGLMGECRHFVASYEQRSCFPLDSIRDEEGKYPARSYEVVYPGVHSDVGGGYPKNDQGKARGGTDELISQVVLHDLYAEAFAAGAPLQVPKAAMPEFMLTQQPWRQMDLNTQEEFDVSPLVVERFNAWRAITLPGVSTAAPEGLKPWEYKPVEMKQPVEEVLANQLTWITGWRIGRFANDQMLDDDSYKRQPFFTQAVDVTPHVESEERKAYEREKKSAEGDRIKHPESAVNRPGPRIYEPTLDKTQMSQAAAEFKADYLERPREQTSWQGTLLDVVLRDSAFLLNEDDERKARETLKREGLARSQQLFRDTQGTPSSDPSMALLVALFDDQIHDSRAWFMHDKLKTRELWGGYFFYRMVYFGNDNSAAMTPVMIAGRILGVVMIAGATVYGIRLMRGNALKAAARGLVGLASGVLLSGVAYQVIDAATGVVVPFVPGAEDLLKPTTHIGAVARALKDQIVQEEYLSRLDRTTAMLREAGNLFELDKGTT